MDTGEKRNLTQSSTTKLLIGWVVAGLALLVSTTIVLAQQDFVPNPYQGQNVGRFQVFFSPFARADTFLVDTTNAETWVLVKDKDGTPVYQRMAYTGFPKSTIRPIGRFRVFFGTHARADTWVVDTLTGCCWCLVVDKDGITSWEPRKVEGITP